MARLTKPDKIIKAAVIISPIHQLVMAPKNPQYNKNKTTPLA
jgi:hypothetical protein